MMVWRELGRAIMKESAEESWSSHAGVAPGSHVVIGARGVPRGGANPAIVNIKKR